jgi:hypothetical protein
VARSIVVAFRMSPAGMIPGPEGSYLARARSLCVRGEALGGYLVAWSAAELAMGWDFDSIEEAILFAVSIREEALSPARAWASGVAEGELDTLSPDGDGILAWGPALLSSTSLAQVARAGEVLVDGDVRAVRAGQLTLLGQPEPAGEARRVCGWRLDLEHPWNRTDPELRADASKTAGATRPSLFEPPADGALAARVHKLARSAENVAAVDALAALRRARARVEGGPLPARCQASLALALMLSLAGRAEESLLEALDALARAREAHDPRAIGACMALLAKLYAGAGFSDAATALRDNVG